MYLSVKGAQDGTSDTARYPADDHRAESGARGGYGAHRPARHAADDGQEGRGRPLSESFTSSLHSLSANVTRTILTMLGIIIGVASVIALLAYGNGVVAKALTTLERNGTNLDHHPGGEPILRAASPPATSRRP